jgi:hypothetical protein
MNKALRRSARLAPRWIALALSICVGLGAARPGGAPTIRFSK